MFIQLFIAIIFAVSLSVSGHYYVFERVLEPLVGYSDFVWITIFSLLCVFSFLGFVIIRILPHFYRKFIEFFMFMWMGGLFIFLVMCVLTIPAQIIFYLGNIPEKYLSLFIMFGSLFLIIYSMFQALRQPRIFPVTVPLPHCVPSSVENLCVVVLSDIHVSGLIGKRRMARLAEKVNALEADFIFLTGDLMDGSLRQLKREIQPLQNLKAKVDIIYITGNHEYYSGPLAWKNHFEKEFRWTVLSNTSKVIKVNDLTMNIIGIEDKHWLSHERLSRKNDMRFVKGVDHLDQMRSLEESAPPLETCVNILLAHQPKDAKYLHHFPWINLQISGHTHGGQIWPLKYLVYRDQKYNAGLYRMEKNQFIYVNQGTGFWGPPMRLGTRGEITCMKFQIESSAGG
jgi:predicted MPP superfamily phosphohydrolase